MRILKRLILGLFILLLIATLGTAALIHFKGDEIKQRIVAELLESTGLSIGSEAVIDLSVLSHFPLAAVRVMNVQLDKADSLSPVQLGKMEEISLLIHPFQLLENNIELHSLSIKNGTIYLNIDEAGNFNWQGIAAKKGSLHSDSGSTKNQLLLSLDRAEFNHVRIVYGNDFSSLYCNALIEKANLKARAGQGKNQIEAEFEILSEFVQKDEQSHLENKQLAGLLNLQFDSESKLVNVEKGKLSINDNLFTVKGHYRFEHEIHETRIALSAEGSDIENILDLIPENYKAKLQGAHGKGKYTIHASIDGKIGPEHQPHFYAKFKFEDGEVYIPLIDSKIEQLAFEGHYSNGVKRHPSSSELQIDSLRFQHKSDWVQAQLLVTNFIRPRIKGMLTGKVELQSVNEFISAEKQIMISGAIRFAELSLDAELADFEQFKAEDMLLSGQIIADQANFIDPSVRVTDINGTLELNQTTVETELLTCTVNGNRVQFNGQVDDLHRLIGLNKLNAEDRRGMLKVNGDLYAEQIDLISLLSKPEKAENDSTVKINVLHLIAGEVTVSVDELTYEGVQLSKIDGQAHLTGQELNFSQLNIQGFGGTVTGSGQLSYMEPEHTILTADLNFNKIEVQRIFSQFNEFGQSDLTSNQLRGILTADVNLSADWGQQASFKREAFTMNTDLKIENGALINYKPLLSLSKHIDVNELRHVEFDRLQNSITIANEQIVIPEMHINSSVLALNLEGTHTFSNDIDYLVQLNLRQILAKKFRKNRPNDNWRERKDGGIELFISMKGHASDPEIQLERTSILGNLKSEFKSERDEWKEIRKKEQPRSTPDSREVDDEDEDFNFIEWDDEGRM